MSQDESSRRGFVLLLWFSTQCTIRFHKLRTRQSDWLYSKLGADEELDEEELGVSAAHQPDVHVHHAAHFL